MSMVTKAETPFGDSVGERLKKLCHPGAERAYVAAVLEKNELIDDMLEDDLSMFTDPNYRQILGYIAQLFNEGWKDIDRRTIVNLAERHERVRNVLIEMGGIEALERICSYQMSVVNFQKNRAKLKELHSRRNIAEGIIQQSLDLLSAAEDDEKSPEDLLKIAEQSLGDISQRIYSKTDYFYVQRDPQKYYDNAKKELDSGITFKGIPTNMPGYDEMMGGFGVGRLHVFGANTGCGKSLLAINLAVSVAYGLVPGDPMHKVAIIDTGELMFEEDFWPRFLACDSGVKIKSIQKNWWVRNEGDVKAVCSTIEKFNEHPIIWYQMPDFDANSVKAAIKRLVKREGVEIVFFDNIKINPNWQGRDPYNKIGDLAQAMKEAAMECRIPVVAFIQLGADGTLPGRKKLNMSRPHVAMFAGGQRTLHNVDVGGVLDWEDYEDYANDNRLLIIQKARNDRIHRKDEYMLCIGDLRRARLTITENRTKSPIDTDGSPNPTIANNVIQAESEIVSEAIEIDQDTLDRIDIVMDQPAEAAPPKKSLADFRRKR